MSEQQVYRVLLTQSPMILRPTKKTIQALTYHLPKCRILGFGYYHYYKLSYLLVYSPTFPLNPFSGISNLTWNQATGTTPATTTHGWEPAKL